MNEKLLKDMEAVLKAFNELKESENVIANRNVETVEEETEEIIPESARPFQALDFCKKDPLTLEEALGYFEEEAKAVTEFPWKPQGGTVVLFKAKTVAHNEDWRANGHRFYQVNGGRWVKNGLIKRRLFNITTKESKSKSGNPGFQMISWVHKEKELLTLVQFIGDEKLSVDRPHGKSKKTTNYVRSAPSLIRELEVGTQKPFQQYQDSVFDAPSDAGSQNLRVPRNTTQVRNARQRYRRMNKGTDSFSNLNRISLENEDVRLLMTIPDLVMVNITPEMLKQTRDILKIDYDKASIKQLLGYDTQFQLGNYYVSWICIRDIRMKDRKSGKSPVIPIVQVIHERKIAMHHDIAWTIITNLIPEICTAKFLATSDAEFTPLLKKVSLGGCIPPPPPSCM